MITNEIQTYVNARHTLISMLENPNTKDSHTLYKLISLLERAYYQGLFD